MSSERNAPGSNDSANATSRSLILRVRRHDPEAWDRLVDLYAPLVFHYCRRARLADDDASDVFQEVFQTTFTKIDRFQRRGPSDTFRGWLATITQNKIRDLFRRRDREPQGVGGSEIQARLSNTHAPDRDAREGDDDAREMDAAGAFDDATRAEAECNVLQAALDSIRSQFQERTWSAFVATVIEGRTPKHVGEELGMTQGAVRVAKSRVLQRLRAELGDLPPGAGCGTA